MKKYLIYVVKYPGELYQEVVVKKEVKCASIEDAKSLAINMADEIINNAEYSDVYECSVEERIPLYKLRQWFKLNVLKQPLDLDWGKTIINLGQTKATGLYDSIDF